MARKMNKADVLRYIAYISYDSITELYTVWYKGDKSPCTSNKENISKSAKEFLKHSHKYTYGVSTYYRLER